jgi:outer membrane lipoprotein-sorting protein
VLGTIIFVVLLLGIVPAVLMSGMVAAGVLGESVASDAEARFEGSELLDLNK